MKLNTCLLKSTVVAGLGGLLFGRGPPHYSGVLFML